MFTKIKKPVTDVILVIALSITAFYIGFYHDKIKNIVHPQEAKFSSVQNLKTCSVAISDRGELLIISRSNGTYEVYDEAVGLSIFKSYANRITATQPK